MSLQVSPASLTSANVPHFWIERTGCQLSGRKTGVKECSRTLRIYATSIKSCCEIICVETPVSDTLYFIRRQDSVQYHSLRVIDIDPLYQAKMGNKGTFTRCYVYFSVKVHDAAVVITCSYMF